MLTKGTLTLSHSILVCRGTSFENHWSSGKGRRFINLIEGSNPGLPKLYGINHLIAYEWENNTAKAAEWNFYLNFHKIGHINATREPNKSNERFFKMFERSHQSHRPLRSLRQLALDVVAPDLLGQISRRGVVREINLEIQLDSFQ